MIDHINLSEPEAMFAIANTPLFLVRKLRSDPAVFLVSQQYTAAQLIEMLRDISQHAPESLRDRVLPYVILVALAIKSDIQALKDAEKINVDADWYKYIAAYLIQRDRNTSQVFRLFSQSPRIDTIENASTASVQRVDCTWG